MVNTMTGRCLVRQTVFRRERLGQTRLQVAAALFRHRRIRPTLRFRSTTARDQTSSLRTCASPRRLGLGNRPEQRLAVRVRAVVRAVLVAQADQVQWAVAEVAPVVAVAADAVALEAVLAVAAVQANDTISPLEYR